MSVREGRNILITGRPGIGKSTLIIRLAERLEDRVVGGFYTEEIRRGGRREGFQVAAFSGQTATLAHVSFKSRHRVGRYGVDVAAFESIAMPEFARPCDLMLIDEIGKMECFSARFVVALRDLLDGTTPVVATVAGKGAGLIAEVKNRPDVELYEVTNTNRDELPQRLLERLK